MENKKAAKVLSNAFKGLRNIQYIIGLDWHHAYISGLVAALTNTGCISNGESTKIQKRSDDIYRRRREELMKEESQQRYCQITHVGISKVESSK